MNSVSKALTAHCKYLRYVVVHKWYVFQYGLMFGVPFHQMILHDWTKFLPDEWFNYANHFYNDGRSLDVSWLKHQNRNKHHWQYWVLNEDCGTNKPLPMPKRFAREMLADWYSCSRMFNGNVKEWYAANRWSMYIHPETRAFIEALMKLD